MIVDSIEIVQDGNKMFGLYRDGNVLIKQDPDILSAIHDSLVISLAIVDEHLSALHVQPRT
jgi:hypothetical protein